MVWLEPPDLCHSLKLILPEPLWWCNPRVGKILLQIHLYPGCHLPGHSRDQHLKNKPQWTLGSPHWWLSHYPKEPNCSHYQSWPGLCSQVQSNKWVDWGSRREHSEMFSGPKSLVWDTSWVPTGFWGAQPLFFIIPSFTFKLTFWVVLLRSFGQSFMRWSGLQHLKQFQFLSLIYLNCIGKMDNIPNWSAPPTPLEVSASSRAEDSASSSPSGFTSESSSASLLSTEVDWAVKVQMPFNFREKNKIPDVWEWVTFDPPVVVVFRSRGSLGSVHLSNLQIAMSRSQFLVGCSLLTLWANICQYVEFRPSQMWSHFISTMCSCWILPRYSDRSIWTCCYKCTPYLGTFSPDPSFRE